jgi:hypothetical protein
MPIRLRYHKIAPSEMSPLKHSHALDAEKSVNSVTHDISDFMKHAQSMDIRGSPAKVRQFFWWRGAECR